MGKLLAVAALLGGLYYLNDSQRIGSSHRLAPSVGASLPSFKGTPGASVGAAAVGAAARVGN
jgi:hypothetical protein